MQSDKTNETEFLFQKLGNTWYVMGVVNDEVIYTALPENVDPKTTKLELYEVIEEHLENVAEYQKGPAAAA
jgi:hypothetical protein